MFRPREHLTPLDMSWQEGRLLFPAPGWVGGCDNAPRGSLAAFEVKKIPEIKKKKKGPLASSLFKAEGWGCPGELEEGEV